MVNFGIDWEKAENAAIEKGFLDKDHLLQVSVDTDLVDLTKYPGAINNLGCYAICDLFEHSDLTPENYRTANFAKALDKFNHPEYYLREFFLNNCTEQSLRNFASEKELLLPPLADQYGITLDEVTFQLYDIIVNLWLNS